ncbi:sugar ABC transporter permease [Oerskovia sp. M15]
MVRRTVRGAVRRDVRRTDPLRGLQEPLRIQRDALGLGGTQEIFDPLFNYAYALSDSTFLTSIGRVLLFGVVQVPVMLVLALGIALLIDSASARAKAFFRLSSFAPYAVPTVVSALMWSFLYSPTNSPVNQLLEVFGLHVNFLSQDLALWAVANVVTWGWTGYNMIIIYAALQGVRERCSRQPRSTAPRRGAPRGASRSRSCGPRSSSPRSSRSSAPRSSTTSRSCSSRARGDRRGLHADHGRASLAPVGQLPVRRSPVGAPRRRGGRALRPLLPSDVQEVLVTTSRVPAVAEKTAGGGQRHRRAARKELGRLAVRHDRDHRHEPLRRHRGAGAHGDLLPVPAVVAVRRGHQGRRVHVRRQPLWFSNFDLFGNIGDLFAYKDGIFAVWMANSALYSIVGAASGRSSRSRRATPWRSTSSAARACCSAWSWVRCSSPRCCSRCRCSSCSPRRASSTPTSPCSYRAS